MSRKRETPVTDGNLHVFDLGAGLRDWVPAEVAREIELAAPGPPDGVRLPVVVRGSGSDAWLEDAAGNEVVKATAGFSESEHVEFLEWVASVANRKARAPE